MKFEKEASLHNKFEIEVRDIRTGEIKQKAYAHNLVTNYGLQKAMRGVFLPQGRNICIGRLATEPKPTNIRLNSQIGYKTSTLEELVINEDEGYGYRKMKIVLLPSEFVGEKITEVGLGFGKYLHTHAILQDSEGNSVSINKTDVDEITIYATLYVRGEMGNGSVVSVTRGVLYRCLTSSSTTSSSDNVRIAEGGHVAKRKSSVLEDNYTSVNIGSNDVIYDDTNMIRRCKARFEADNGNHLINAVGTDSCRIGLLESSFWNGMYWEGQIGVGDGVTTEFDTPFHTIDSSRIGNNVKVNGLNKEVELSDFRSDISLGNLIYDYKGINPFPFLYNKGEIKYSEKKVIDIELVKSLRATEIKLNGYAIYSPQAIVSYSTDGKSYTAVSGKFLPDKPNTLTIPEKAKYLKFEMTHITRYPDILSNAGISVKWDIPKQIKFTEPPAAGEIITAKLWVDGIPKDNKHVLDITIDLKFKDGGAI